MTMKDINTYDLPLWLQKYWEDIENECFFKLKNESEQYKKLYDECDKILDNHVYIANILDGDAVRHPMELGLEETKLLSEFLQKLSDQQELGQMQMYLLGCRDMYHMLKLLEIVG